ncbi:MAG TPA: hypothetical protein VK559_05680 [Ferruginibacter sp.]|nr:hypothetical protein [Ferruginibacter sp.]
MRIFFTTLFLSGIILCSCRNKTSSTTVVADSVIKNEYIAKDTPMLTKPTDSVKKVVPEAIDLVKIDANTYSFSLGDDGTEGNQGMAYYENGEIKKITFTEFGEDGQFRMTYSFLKNNSILLCEKDFSYPQGIDSVLTDKDMHLDKDTCSSIDYSGNEIGSGKMDSTSMGAGYLSEIKKIVPFTLGK